MAASARPQAPDVMVGLSQKYRKIFPDTSTSCEYGIDILSEASFVNIDVEGCDPSGRNGRLAGPHDLGFILRLCFPLCHSYRDVT